MKQLLFSILLITFGTASVANAQATTLLVDFSASPSTGLAPLNSVDLSAVVSGTATGTITYRFDCTGDNVWDNVYSSASTSYTAPDLCNYLNPGAYTARAMVERGGLSSQGSIEINVTTSVPVPTSLVLTTLARNVSSGQALFGDPISAKPSDKVEFQIQVSKGSGAAYSVTLKDILPSTLSYLGNLKVDGVANSGNIASGIFLGDISSNNPRFITFEAQVAPDASFSLGSNDVINTASALGTNAAGSDAMTLKVQRSAVLGAATSVSTGAFSSFGAALLISLAIGFLLSYTLLLRFYIKNHVLPKAFQQKAVRDLESVVQRIRRRQEQLA